MLHHLSGFVIRRRRAVLALAVILVVAFGAFGMGVESRLVAGGNTSSSSESARAEAMLAAQFHQAPFNFVLLVTARHASVDDPAVAAAGAGLTARLAGQPGVGEVASYWSLDRLPPLRSSDSRQALVFGVIKGSDNTVQQHVADLVSRFSVSDAQVTVIPTGSAVVEHDITTQSKEDLHKAEMITLPVTLVLLVLVFGSAVGALLPLAVAGVSIAVTLGVLRLLTTVTSVSVFALNLTTAMGLALAIDYCLLIANRFKEELRDGRSTDEAVRRAVATAGRTVVISATTVMGSLCAMFVFPLVMLRSFAYAGMAVVALSALGAVVVLPALLSLVGPNINRLVLFHYHPRPVGESNWHRLAMFVMRRPVVIAGAVLALLLVLGSPFLGLRLGLPDQRVLPAGNASRVAASQITADFASRESEALPVVTATPAAVPARADAAFAARLSALPGVARVDSALGSFTHGAQVTNGALAVYSRFRGSAGTWWSVVPSVEPYSGAGQALVAAIRSVPAPASVLVGGSAADFVDAKAAVVGHAPEALGVIALVTFVVIFLLFGSLLLPIKAVILNCLSLSASFGAMVWVFQRGNLHSLLAFTSTGYIDTTTPVLMFCLAFGLSMDYEVFLLSRIQEEYERTHDNTAAVAWGLQETGRIVTSAAAILAMVFIAFIISGVSIMKLLGLGLALAILMDATLVRALLVPALMRMAGDANWWLPKHLRIVHDRFGIKESGPAEVPLVLPAGAD